MRTIVILNLKGGTAKTVTAATMARCLAAVHQQRVLVIDADCQGNLSQYFGVDMKTANGSTLELLTTGAGYWPDFMTRTREGIDIIPSDMSLAYADLPDGGANAKNINELRECLEEDDAFDYVIIDLPPSLGVATQAALLAADEVIIPIRLDAFSTAGMAELMGQVYMMRRLNPRLRVAGVLGTQYCRTPEEDNIHRYLTEDSALPVFRTRIRMSAPVPRSIMRQESILTYSPTCGAAKDYRAFVEEYLDKEAGGNA